MNLPQAQRDSLVPIVGALFALPFILFSMTGGYFADRYSKRNVTIGTKLFEIAVMVFFIVSLALRSLPMECAGVFLISTEGALFGPSKYGLLPELLPEPKLSWGNGIIEFGTFLAGMAARWPPVISPSNTPGTRRWPASCSWHSLAWGSSQASGSRACPLPIPRKSSAGTCSAISRRK